MDITQTTKLLTLAYRQWPHLEIDLDLVRIWHKYLGDVSTTDAGEALGEALGESEFPPTIAQIVKHLPAADDHWIAVERLLTGGKFNQPLTLEDFPDQRSFNAARSVAPRLRKAEQLKARGIYREAWRNSAADGTVAIGGTAVCVHCRNLVDASLCPDHLS